MPLLSTPDLIALAFFLGAWAAYAAVIEWSAHGRRGLNAEMDSYRETWMRQMLARLIHGGAGRRRDLDLRLQHFRHDTVAELFAGEVEEFFVNAAHGPARFGVEHEVFFFHADRVHARNNSPGRERVPALARCKTAAKRVGGRF